ncbi:MAG: glutamine synthetase [Frankiales bacterium]|jgi:glutamine synthetase|nr:glutamine synthetase [Frankiales bacterium]MDX6243373.1 glutamine synthetase [Frankiales bacterium]
MDTVHPLTDEHTRLAQQLHDDGVRYVTGGWIDVMGRTKSKFVPIDHLPNLLAGSERYTPRGMGGLGAMNPYEDEVVAMPDASTLQVLPWDTRFAWMAADMSFGGREPWALCPRSILKKQLAIAADQGLRFNLGVETEFYAFQEVTDPTAPLVPMAKSGTNRPTPAYDIESTMDAMPFLDKMVSAMQTLGYGVFSFDHEGGDGQFEFDFAYDNALAMADKITLFRLMARQIAKQCGLTATFMPKPTTGGWGSGHHYNMSLEDLETGQNLFRDSDDPSGQGWSKTAYSFVAGIMKHARSLAALATPTVNSYKRLAPRLADGSISWAPMFAAYGYNNRSCMLRLPANRPAVENRGVDSAANTYLTSAMMLAAGLEGIAESLDPGDPVSSATYDWTERTAGDPAQAVPLPRNLLEGIEAFEADPLVHEVFAPQFVKEYAEMRRAEWDEYHAQVTDWERRRYLLDL